MQQVIETYKKWCLRLSTARLNRWLRKVMSRHSWKDVAGQPKVKYFTQVKARPPTFVAFVSGKTRLLDTDLRFLTRSLKEDFDTMGGIPVRILHRAVVKNTPGSNNNSKTKKYAGKRAAGETSDKRITQQSTPLKICWFGCTLHVVTILIYYSYIGYRSPCEISVQNIGLCTDIISDIE
ncbi:putative K domain-like, alpha/beta, GTPase Der KH-domain-containing protein [Helianthus annuus]|nr:putative K domain-like, alpha/beta, GTPase Der KH-domain-containing protein [Helianthus annuus]KAJ0687525.1 putative K domain-like, alpha/beta, GTPase Der KH-domain-containing protein [Helianthus annuus]